MPRVDGRMFICDRCGVEVFKANSPGVNVYHAQIPDGWSDNSRLLCPKCTDTLKQLYQKFMNGTIREDD